MEGGIEKPSTHSSDPRPHSPQSHSDADPTAPRRAGTPLPHGSSLEIPGAAPAPRSNLTKGPRGISSEASLALPRHTGLGQPPTLEMEQPGAPRYPPGAGSRLSHLPGSRGCAQPGPSRWRMVAPASPQLSRNSVPPRPPHWRGRTRRFPPHSAPGMEGSDPRPRGGAQWPPAPLPLLAFLFSLLPPPRASVRLLPQRHFPALLPQERRPPTRKCPGVTPATAAMETLPAPAPPRPAPSHGAGPPPPPSCTHSEARRCPARPRSPPRPPPFWAPNEGRAAPAGW